MLGWLWTLPLVGAFVGYCTNWFAVRMLFRPREPVRFLFFTIQGLIPRKRKEVAETIAHLVENYLLKSEDIGRIMDDPLIALRLRERLDKRLTVLIQEGMDNLVPPEFRGFITPEMIDRLRETVLDKIVADLPGMINDMRVDLTQSHGIRELIEERVNEFDVQKLNRMIEMVSSSGFRRIEILGGVLGAVIGCIQWAFLFLIS